MADTTLVHGVDFQRAVLRLMMLDAGFCGKAVDFLKDGYFTGELSWFFRKIKNYYTDFRRPMSSAELQTEIFKHGDATEIRKYEAERQAIVSTDVSTDKHLNPDYIKRELTGFVRANVFVGSYQEAAQLYNSGNKQSAFEFTKDRLDQLLNVDFEREQTVDCGDYKTVLAEAAQQRGKAIPTGIHPIDQAMGGGLLPQTWTTFLGGSNVGKSMLCPNLAYAAVMAGKKVFITVHEDEINPTLIRYFSRFTGIPMDRLALPESMRTPAEESVLAGVSALIKDKIKLRFMYGNESFIERLQDVVYQQHDQWQFDLFLCDYGQCLKSRAFKNMDNSYSVQEFIYSELKQLCLALNIAGAGGAQVNRQGHKVGRAGSDFLRMTDVGDSWGIAKKSSNVITMNRSQEDMANNRITFLLDKVRHGRCPVAVQCVTDYSRAMVYNPDPLLQAEISVSDGPSANTARDE